MSAVLLILCLGCFVLALLASVTRRALREFSLHELGRLGELSNQPELVGNIFRSQDRVALGAEIVQAVALVAAGGLGMGSRLVADVTDLGSAALLFAMLIIAAVLFDVWLAVPLARISATKFLFRTWKVLSGVSALLTPISLTTRAFEIAVFRLSGRSPQPPTEETLEDEIRTIVTEGQREGLLEEDAREMIEGVIELGDVNVGEVMTPRPEMLTLHVSTGLEEAARFFVEAGHSRIPVYDKSRDDMVGILYMKDLLAELLKEPKSDAATLGSLVRPPVFVPESKPIDDLLQEFQRQRTHMAIVLNEFGGVAGLVTIEDILEEIVGDIVDEHDEEVDGSIRRIDEHTCEVPARARIDEINEELGLHLEENGVETIGGFVFSELGHVPRPGEQLLWKNVRMTVLDVKHRRVERVRIEVVGSEE
jgi:CBS domain containing-hemolysin-like protein